MKRSEAWHWILTAVLFGMVLWAWSDTADLRAKLDANASNDGKMIARIWDDEQELGELGVQLKALRDAKDPDPIPTATGWGHGSIAPCDLRNEEPRHSTTLLAVPMPAQSAELKVTLDHVITPAAPTQAPIDLPRRPLP